VEQAVDDEMKVQVSGDVRNGIKVRMQYKDSLGLKRCKGLIGRGKNAGPCSPQE
jgi:hypothetical protein